MTHPYKKIASYANWRKAVAGVKPENIDPVVSFPIKLETKDLVATAGSCFAQHIARHLKASGFSYYIAEDAHPILGQEVGRAFGFGLFSCRYGNIYTSRQLVQLFDRAFGNFTPSEDAWLLEDGSVVDPFRPTVEPGGFASEAEMRADRAQHLAKVREMFTKLDFFVFTLGLTECWISKADGATFPVCPGVSGGTFDPDRHAFQNLSVDEVVSDMRAFARKLKVINPAARIIVTVSPVPLMATAQDRHVLVSTTVSKAILRIACETLIQDPDSFAYFPSFEIVTGAFSRGQYFGEDLRSVTEAGVAHVMRLFLKHATAGAVAAEQEAAHTQDVAAEARALVEVICDEDAYGR